MKKLKLAASKTNEALLSREQLKQVLGGAYEEPGGCQKHDESCDTSRAINCCNLLVCADYKCYWGTI